MSAVFQMIISEPLILHVKKLRPREFVPALLLRVCHSFLDMSQFRESVGEGE